MSERPNQTRWRLVNSTAHAIGAVEGTIDLSRPWEGAVIRRAAGQDFSARWAGLRFRQTHWPSVSAEGLIRCDAFIRGSDLIAAYPPSTEFPFQVAVLRRWIHAEPCRNATAGAKDEALHGHGTGLETIVSVNTPLPEIQPALELVSYWPQGEIYQLRWIRWPVEPQPLGDLPAPVANEARRLGGPGEMVCTRNDGPSCWVIRPAGEGLASLSFAEMLYPADFEHSALAIDASAGGWAIRHCFFTRPLEKGVILRCRWRTVCLPRDGDLARAAALYTNLAQELPAIGT